MNKFYFEEVENINDKELIKKKTKELIKKLGGIKQNFKNYNRILIKPNFVLGRSSKTGVTTDWSIIEAVIEEVKEANKQAAIIESGGMGYTSKNNPLVIGFKKYCESLSIEFIDPLKCKNVKINGIEIPEIVMNSGLINIPKIKTHETTTISNAIKNLFGLIPPKSRYYIHSKNLHKGLSDVFKIIKPRMNISDGLNIMHGNGPALGKVFNSNILAGSNDAAYLDFVICNYLSIDPLSVEHVKYSIEKDFKLPNKMPRSIKLELPNRGFIYKTLIKILFSINKNLYYPIFKTDLLPIRDKIFRQKPDINKCESCNNCTVLCPLNSFNSKTKTINYKKCKICHWCIAAETCKKQKIKPRSKLYLKGFLEFFSNNKI